MMKSPRKGVKFSAVADSISTPFPVFRRCRSPSRNANAAPTPAAASDGTPVGAYSGVRSG